MAGRDTTQFRGARLQAFARSGHGIAVKGVIAALLGSSAAFAEDVIDIPSAASAYNVSKGILLLADTTQDAPGTTAKSIDSPAQGIKIETDTVRVRAKQYKQIGLMPGLSLTREEIPGNVQSISAKEIKEAHAVSLTDLMNSHLQSVNVNDYQSNPFQMDVTYRGFTASPQLGTSQGLSVFLDGIRVNEPFGDVVNWDMIPLNALSGLDVIPGSNPLFGLGTLGGALSMKTKSGFDSPGVDAEVLTGAFGRKQLQVSAGANNGVVAGFFAASLFDEDGWRKDSPSKVNQVFGKAEWRGEKLQLGLSTLYAGNDLVGNGLLPKEVAINDPSKVFTSPDETKNRLLQFQLSGQWDVSEKFSVTGQVYRRNSKRKSLTTDVNEQFGGLSTRRPNPGEKVAPGFPDVNRDGLPDYNAWDLNVAGDANGLPLDTNGNSMFIDDGSGNGTYMANPASNGTPLVGTDVLAQAHPNQAMWSPDGVTTMPFWTAANPFGTGTLNSPLPAQYYQFALNAWNARHLLSSGPNSYEDPRFPTGHPACGGCIANLYDVTTLVIAGGPVTMNYTDNQGFLHYLNITPILADPGLLAASSVDQRLSKGLILPTLDPNTGQQNAQFRNGADAQSAGPYFGRPQKTGFIDGTPTALITNTEIDQVSDGGALQLNWNLDKHQLMVGASVDMADASYTSAQMLGLLDANHKGYLDPANIGAEFSASTTPIGLNDFKGDSITRSLYASETWSPVDPLHITAAARYNHTRVNNTLAINNRLGLQSANAFLNFYSPAVLCPTNDPASCPDAQLIPFSVAGLQQLGHLGGPETEKFTYHSFNPSLGATWQANEALNLYGNWNRGARTPSVIELGCAFDATPIYRGNDASGKPLYSPRSMYERRFCSLPSTMSGDPYLKQVQSETFEVGARGTWGADLEWNATAYRTDLQDDIYFVSFAPDRSFFQNIGNTRRQGLEFGVKGKAGKASFRVNYSLTDATFQSNFSMASPNNSSASSDKLDTSIYGDPLMHGMVKNNYQQIQVNPGNRMPGVPLHNLNASVEYDLTDRWKVGLTTIVHSSAFVRGNENNQHRAGPATPIHSIVQCGASDPGYANGYCAVDIPRPDFRYDGKTNGYAVFNFQTSYKMAKEWTLSLIVNNLFDKTYYSAGRLGTNPFSPTGPNGGIVSPVTGFNYNSNDWLATNFLAPGAPRAAWVSLSYEFDPAAK